MHNPDVASSLLPRSRRNFLSWANARPGRWTDHLSLFKSTRGVVPAGTVDRTRRESALLAQTGRWR